MVSTSKFESLAQRFAPYIDELQDFFSSRKVPFGTPGDLQAFPGRLQDPAFHEEMTSMVRSIVYRESEAVPRTELMEMLAIAVAGPRVEESAPELHEPLRQLLIFVTEVVRSQRLTLPPDFSLDDEEDIARPQAAELVIPAAIPGPVVAQNPDLHALGTLNQSGHAAPLPTNDRLSRALIHSEDNVDAAPAPQAHVPFAPRPPFVPQRAGTAGDVRRFPRSFSSFLRQAYWIPGVCVLLLAVAVAYYLKGHSQPHPAAVPQGTTLPANTGLAKPSAYGPPIRSGRSRAQRASSEPNGSVPEPGAFTLDQPGNRTAADGRSSSPAIGNPPFPRSAKHSDLRPALTSSSISPRVLGGREGVFLASSGMMAAHLLTAPAPHYPKLASIAHVEGEVIVQVVVARDGRVEATRVLEGPRLLRSAAEHAIRRWRYRPYVVDGKPTDVATIVTVNFRLSR